MTNKKLKDLKKGDRIWLWDFDVTTPIYVDNAKRDGDLMRVTVKWDDSICECFGHALGYTCVGYDRRFGENWMFTCSFNISHENYMEKTRIRNIVPSLKELIAKIEKI